MREVGSLQLPTQRYCPSRSGRPAGGRGRTPWAAGLLVLLFLAAGWPAAAEEHAGGETADWHVTLDEVIRTALKNNRRLIDARLERKLQQLSLEQAEDRYRPKGSVGGSSRVRRDARHDTGVSAQSTLRVRTGGRFTLRWTQPVEGGADASGTYSLGFSQPLLRGGWSVETVPLRVARLNEESHVLSFRDTIAGVVVSLIRAWRSLTRAYRSLEISEAALGRARRQLEVNRALVQAGDMAERELLQSEADIANRELDLIQARNSLTSANFALIDLLDVESTRRVRPAASEPRVHEAPGVEEAIELALRNGPGYRSALLGLEIARLGLEQAENGRLWDLSLDVNATGRSGGSGSGVDYGAGVNLSVPLWDRSSRDSVTRARASVEQAERGLEELRQSIGIAVRQAVHDVEVGRRRTELAVRARELSEQKLEIERLKLREGLSSSFQLTRFEDDLVRAQNGEVEAKVSYENALTALDRILGTTLERWGIRVEQVRE